MDTTIYNSSNLVHVPNYCPIEFVQMYTILVLRNTLSIPNREWYITPSSPLLALTNLQDICIHWPRIGCNKDSTHGTTTIITALSLENANLTGIVPPELWIGLPYLQSLDMFSNPNVTGTLPITIGDNAVLASSLTNLKLHDTSISGSLPSSIQKLTQLQQLDLNHTYLTGSIPKELCNLQHPIHIKVSCDRISCSCCTPNCTTSNNAQSIIKN